MIANNEIARSMTVKLEDIFRELPEMPEFREGIRRGFKNDRQQRDCQVNDG